MTGAADPMMKSPAGTAFTPYSIVRNISDQPVSIALSLYWMEAGAAKAAQLQPLTIPPHRTRDLDAPSFLAMSGLKNFNGSVSLILDVKGDPRSLLMTGGSVDHKNTYLFEVMPTRIHEGIAKSISYWSIANGDDTMVTLWNSADEAQDFIFTLFFTGGHYDFPIHLGPRATNTFNVSEIVHNQVPDAEGNVIPASIHEGSARISGTFGTAQSILVSMEAGTYNVAKATCGTGCETCDGWVEGSEIDVSPLAMSVGGTDTVTFIVPFKDGTQRDYTSSTTWSTNDTSIATVKSAGVIKGVAVGTFTAKAEGPDLTPGYVCCSPTGGCCNPPSPPAGTGPGTVASLTCTSSVTRGGTATCTVTPSSVTVTAWQFKDGSGNTVTRTQDVGSLTWSGVMVASGTVSVTVSGLASPVPASITVNARTDFAFTAVSPSQASGNSITCYNGDVETLQSPPVNTSIVGASCADLIFSFVSAPAISDNGPNDGYQYLTSVSSTGGGQQTQFLYIVVTDLLSATTFYTAQCGTYSSSDSSGFIAGSQLKQNVFDHEEGSVLSHWTEYRNAQNNSSNNIGTVLEAKIGTPGTSQADYDDDLTNTGNAAINDILAAAAVEPCGGSPNDDSSQSCKYCGTINYSPYTSCGNSQPVAYCQ